MELVIGSAIGAGVGALVGAATIAVLNGARRIL